jgi:glycerate kinase
MPNRPLTIVVAPNAFKGTLTALQAADCIERGLHAALPRTRVIKVPVADGGDGTLHAIVYATGGTLRKARVRDPLGRTITATWGLSGDREAAILEMAAASGLALLSPNERNPLITSTEGTGDLLRIALDSGARNILLGIGGSSTNDAGTGAARALGARFLDIRGRDLPPGGAALARLHQIDLTHLDPRLRTANIQVACDVTNPLTGPRGASHIYGPQKGASPAMVRRLDAALRHFAQVLRRQLGISVEKIPGSGAAGGMGAGLLAFTPARLRPGIDIVLDAVRLRHHLQYADLVITGEGRLDPQTVHGKAPAGVARLARSLGIPCIALCGSLAPRAHQHLPPGLLAAFSALEEPMDDTTLKKRAAAMLTASAHQLGNLLACQLPVRSATSRSRRAMQQKWPD